jgi:hypothetical protein
MSDRGSTFASGSCVALAIVGSAAREWLLSIAGPLLALGVHMFTEWRMSKRKTDKDVYIDHLKLRVWQLEQDVATLRGQTKTDRGPG